MLGAAPSLVAAPAVFPPTSSQTRSFPAQDFIPRATKDSLLQCVRNSPNPRKSIDFLRSKCSSLFDRKPDWQVGSLYDDHAIVAREKKLSVRGECSVPRPTKVVQVIPAGLPIAKSSGEFAPQPHPTPTCPHAEKGDKAAVKLVPSMSQRAGQVAQPLEVANATHSFALSKVVIAPVFKICYELEPFMGDFMFNQRILDPGGRTIYWALSQHEADSSEHSNKHTLSNSETQHFCQLTAYIYRVVKNRRGMINQFQKTLSTASRSADQAAAAEQPCRTQ